jgi:hypothetical protein
VNNNDVFRRIAAAHVLVLDDISMVDSNVMQLVLLRWMECKRVNSLEELCKCCTLIFAGVFAQLPPVCTCEQRSERGEDEPPPELCEKCYVTVHPIWA